MRHEVVPKIGSPAAFDSYANHPQRDEERERRAGPALQRLRGSDAVRGTDTGDMRIALVEPPQWDVRPAQLRSHIMP